MVIFVAPVSHCVELALFAVDFSGKFPKYVAAVPHLHSIHPSITRESKWRYIMKKINLRELYPDVYTTDFFVDVTEEVMETIRAAERAEAAYERKMYRYKAQYSLDCENGIYCHLFTYLYKLYFFAVFYSHFIIFPADKIIFAKIFVVVTYTKQLHS